MKKKIGLQGTNQHPTRSDEMCTWKSFRSGDAIAFCPRRGGQEDQKRVKRSEMIRNNVEL